MSFDERAYRTLIVSSSAKFNDFLAPLLLDAHCDPVVSVKSGSAAKRAFLENQYDFVIVNAPLTDELGVKFTVDAASSKNTVVLFFIGNDMVDDIRAKLVPYGVFVLPKPTSSTAVSQGLSFLSSARERLRFMEQKTVTIEQRMEEIRLVNRAKWLLIDHLNMTEPDAHRYIEKQAMNTCVSKTEVAKGIISTYAS